jgi:hypothetical protein
MSHAAEERGVSLNSLVKEKLMSAFSPEALSEAGPFSPVADQLEEDALLVGGGTKGRTGRMKRPVTPGKAPSGRRPRPSAAAKGKTPAESGQEPKAPARRRRAKDRKG